MPETILYTCAVCGAPINDSDLEADTTGTLRRLVVNAQAFKAVTTTDAAGNSTVSISEDNPGNPLVFCGQAHAASWAQSWVW